MESTFDDDDRIRLYLLGKLPEQEREEFEKRLMTDDEFFDQLPIIEDELIDDYVHDLLSRPDRERFEGHFLSTPDRLRRLSFARALDHCVSNATAVAPNAGAVKEPSSWWRSLTSFFRSGKPALSLAFGMLLLVAAGGAWLAYKMWQTARPDGETRVEQKDPATTATPGEPTPQTSPQDKIAEGPAPGQTPSGRQTPAPPDKEPSPKPAPPAAARVAAIVSMGSVRSSGETSRVEIRPGEKAVRVQLNLDEDKYPTYRAEIENADRESNYPPQDLKAVDADSRKALFLRLRPDRYPTGDYRVRLKGRTADGELEDVGTYFFRVLRTD